jgi:hypothetical protein
MRFAASILGRSRGIDRTPAAERREGERDRDAVRGDCQEDAGPGDGPVGRRRNFARAPARLAPPGGVVFAARPDADGARRAGPVWLLPLVGGAPRRATGYLSDHAQPSTRIEPRRAAPLRRDIADGAQEARRVAAVGPVVPRRGRRTGRRHRQKVAMQIVHDARDSPEARLRSTGHPTPRLRHRS